MPRKKDPLAGQMTVRQAGRKGGESVKAKYGQGFYSRIGKLGGQSRNRR